MNTQEKGAPPNEVIDASPALLSIEQHEQCCCLRCESIIPREQIARNLIRAKPDEISPTKQRMLAWCEHCRVLYRVVRTLRDGHWVGDSDISIVSNAAQIKSFMARLDHLRGNVQIDQRQKSIA